MCGSRYSSTVSGETACTLPETRGGSGAELLGDSALVELRHVLPDRLNGGAVKVAVARGRTAQQAENVITSLPDSAPSVFVISLGLDDPSSPRVFADRIEEISLLLTGRTVY
jgi:hypothetical protein